jgi:hypothetical protein
MTSLQGGLGPEGGQSTDRPFFSGDSTASRRSRTCFPSQGARKYDPIKIENLNVRVFGACAVVSGKLVLKATTRDRVIEGVSRFVLLVVNTPNGLQVATFQATAIPQPK